MTKGISRIEKEQVEAYKKINASLNWTEKCDDERKNKASEKICDLYVESNNSEPNSTLIVQNKERLRLII